MIMIFIIIMSITVDYVFATFDYNTEHQHQHQQQQQQKRKDSNVWSQIELDHKQMRPPSSPSNNSNPWHFVVVVVCVLHSFLSSLIHVVILSY